MGSKVIGGIGDEFEGEGMMFQWSAT